MIGVILTGMLYDGSAGLHAVQLCGGTCVVQDPDDAVHADMPRNALRRVTAQYVVTGEQLPGLLTRLASDTIMESEASTPIPDHLRIETRIALGENAMHAGVITLGPASTYTCPECHGVLLQLKQNDSVRFRCHTGHAFSAEALLECGVTAIENALWSSVRAIEERVLLLRHIAEQARITGDAESARAIEVKAGSVNRRAELVRQLATESRTDADLAQR